MAYTNIDDSSVHFQTAIWTGNGGSDRAIVNDGNSDMQPDWVWYKSRSHATSNILYDSSRGADYYLKSNTDGAEGSDANMFESFDSDGFSLNADSDGNASGRTYVGWQWKANGGTTASNTSGSITSTVQANTDAGFSIVSFTGNGTDGATVGHGLGAVPAMVLFKCRDTNNTDWRTYHQSISPTNAVSLNSNGAQYGASGVFGGTFTSTLLKVENDTGANRNTSPMIAYCFASKQGYSKFGKYVGNGSNSGPFVWTGFKPAFLLWKITSTTGDWRLVDTKRGVNGAIPRIKPNASSTEGSAGDNVDLLSNGFKFRNTAASANASGETYIFMAFASSPFTTSTGIPTTAR